MNPIFDEAFSLEVAATERLADAPASTSLGSDLACATDLDEQMTERGEDDPLLLAEATIRHITTPRGSLLEDPNYGIDITETLSVATTRQDRAALEGTIRGEVRDDRIETLSVSIEDRTEVDRTMEISIDGEAVTGEPFRLVLAVTDGAVLVQEMEAG